MPNFKQKPGFLCVLFYTFNIENGRCELSLEGAEMQKALGSGSGQT